MNDTNRKRAALIRRIRRFYELLNAEEYMQCFAMIDPRLLDRPESVTFHQYKQSLHTFLEHAGRVRVLKVHVTRLHEDEQTKLYEGRDFALAATVWAGKDKKRREFKERWVLENDCWYNRSTGLVWIDNPEWTDESSLAKAESNRA